MTFSAEQIAAVLGGEIIGNKDARVSDFSAIETARRDTLCFVNDDKYVPYLETTEASIVLVSKGLTLPTTCPPTLIVVENARGAVAQLLKMVSEVLNPKKKGIEQPCYIAEGVDVPEDAYIGAFAYVAKGAKLGKGVQIYPNTYVGENVRLGDNTILYAGVKVYYNCVIGKDCILHAGVVVGGDGFGFEPDAQGVNQKVPQIGNVIIEDDVEIGANTTVDRAMMGSTIIHKNVKIDNLVQVGHNVEIGESTFLCAEVGIAGSTKIGKHCILAGQVGIAGHLEIPDNCVFGAQAGVAGSIKKAGMYQGSPAIDAMQWRKSSVVFKNLYELQKTVNQLEKNEAKNNK